MTPDSILNDAESSMDKAVEYLSKELTGLRTGRASTALVEYLKVDYYGSPTDLKALAAISTPEATQIVIKPFDVSAMAEIRKAIESSNLGLNPQVEDKMIRINVPALSGERRQQLAAQAKKMGEDAKVAVRNVRRDANKHADQLLKDKDAHYPEDEIKTLKDEIQEVLKSHEKKIEDSVSAKTEEITQI